MDKLQTFVSDGKKIRTVLDGDKVWFVAKDVYEKLEISFVGKQSLKNIESDFWGVKYYLTPTGGSQETLFINEQGLYQLIFKSRKPEAKKFTRWVTEVIEQIRKTGSYSIQPKTQLEVLLENVQTMVRHEKEIQELQAKQFELEAKITTVSEEYMTIAGWARKNNKKLSSYELKNLGIQCRNKSIRMGYEIKKVHDERWGEINIYHKDVLSTISHSATWK